MDVLGFIQGIVNVIGGVSDIKDFLTRRRDASQCDEDGYVVEGRITYLEGKVSGQLLMTFSYSADGQRFNKSWSETLDCYRRKKLRNAIQRYSIGDTVLVWCARKDPERCRIVDPE